MSSNDFSLHFVPFIFRYNVRPNNFCSALLVAANIVLVPTASTTATYHRSFLFALCFFLKNDICVELSYCSVFVRLASSSNVVRNLCIESLPIAYRPTWLMKTLFSVFRNLEIPLDGQTQQALLLYLCTHVCDTSANMEATRYADVGREMARSKSGANKRMINFLFSIFILANAYQHCGLRSADTHSMLYIWPHTAFLLSWPSAVEVIFIISTQASNYMQKRIFAIASGVVTFAACQGEEVEKKDGKSKLTWCNWD